MELMEHQEEVLPRLRNGCVLWGGVGTGKSHVAMAYYDRNERPKDIYVITTAKKRDSLDWQRTALDFGLGEERLGGDNPVITVDSWNNLHRYIDTRAAFFVFDEQRVVGGGTWVKSFLKIAKHNAWILLSATPGDTWLDYAPIFVANGYYKNVGEFKRKHVIYEPFVKYPKVKMFWNEKYLNKLREHVLVEMPYIRTTERMVNWLDVGHNEELLKRVWVDRWHVYEDRPLVDIAEMFRVARKVVNSDSSRLEMIRDLMNKCHDRLIIFYNFNYELDILRQLYGEIEVGEWNGHKKDPLPQTDRWVYLVQYVSGSESWNCTDTDAIVFYSLTYSYKNFEQSQGRIDRLNTPFQTLYYYVLVSHSEVDRQIKRSISNKKDFNEKAWAREMSVSMPDISDFDEDRLEVCERW